MDFRLYFKSRQSELVNLLKKIVILESPTGDKKAVDACSAMVGTEFKKAGARIVRIPQKDIGDFHIVEYAPPFLPKDAGQILVLAHVDTVWPVGKITRMPFYISGEKIYGPGVLDMKAGIVMAFSALAAIDKLNIKPQSKIVFFINSAEETGSGAAHDWIRKLAKKSSAVLCLEPAMPGGALKVERKGRVVIRLDAKGKAAHGGSPEKGVSAVEELVSQLTRLKKIRVRETTVNIGIIGGGEKANVVPEGAWAILDIRFWKRLDRDRVMTYFRELEPVLSGAKLKFSVESSTPPMEKTMASAGLFERAGKIASSLDISLREVKSGGGSDASIASDAGAPTLDGLGPEGDGIHADHEHLRLPSFLERTALLTELLSRL
ncbi:MAG: M20 family metallopeptidase [Acidobacteriota bacterium]|nr:M20 family metallopeptidase [Acidobacteriota bacterium]